MSMPTFPIDRNPNFDPDIAPSSAHTEAPYQETPAFPSQIRVHNSLKNGIPMMFWSCIAISQVGIYDVDVRDLPTVTPEQADEHSVAILKGGPEAQRAFAITLFSQAFADQNTMVAWLDDQAQHLRSAVKLLNWQGATTQEGGAA